MSGTLHAGLESELPQPPATARSGGGPATGTGTGTTSLAALATLRNKGRLALILLVAFFGLLTGLAWGLMGGLQDDAGTLERARTEEARLHELTRTARAAEVDAALAQASQQYGAGALRLVAQIDRLRDTGGLGIRGEPPWQAALLATVATFERFQAEPAARTLDSLRAALTDLGHALDEEERRAEQVSAQVASTLHERARSGAVVMLAMAVAGSALFGLALMLFMRHLAVDLDQLRQRALQILSGVTQGGMGPWAAPSQPISPAPRPMHRSPFQGQPPSARQDEVGELALSIEQLAGRLAAQQRELEIERRNVFNQEKQAALGALAAGVLDEIGNPIAAIDGYARALQDTAQQARRAAPAAATVVDDALATQAEFSAAIVREVERLNAITHDMAVLAAPPATERELVSLNEQVGIALGLLRFDARLRDVRVEAALDPALPALRGRADQLVQLVMNLVVNAADAIRDQAEAGEPGSARPAVRNGRIHVTTLTKGKNAHLLIADNGPGMSEDVRRKVFEPLFTTKPAGQGTGLGLPLCQAIVAGHGGSIQLDSTPGCGTTALVVLPLEDGV